MKFGIAVTTSVTPAVTALSQAEYVSRVASAVEEAGYDSIWVSDRTVFPHDLADRYPDRFGPGHANPEAQNVLEAVTTLSYVAGATKSVRLGISVLVLPFRHPVLNAKMITTLDVLSGGRVIFGVGTGWMEEEFASMGASHAERGRITDEHIDMFISLCTQDVAEYEGSHARISGMTFFPKPAQQPHPPIWIGGNSRAALQRTARLGNGWHGIRISPEELIDKRKHLSLLCEKYERSIDSIEISLRMTTQIGEPQHSADGERVPLTGATQQIIDDLRRYEEAGLEYVVLSIEARDTQSTIDSVRRFAAEIAPKI